MKHVRKLSRIPFTQDGFNKIKKEYEELKASRKGAVDTLKQARDMGDLSENGLYKAARARLSSIDFNLRRLDMILKLAQIQEETDDSVVGLGSVVTINDGIKNKELTIVGGYESDPLNGKISTNSPIGRELVGKRIGETIELLVPAGSITYKLIHIKKSS